MNILSIIINILTSGVPCCLLALGIFLTYRLLDFADLTAEGSFLIGGALAVALIEIGVNPILATLVATIGGAICGLITGLLNTKLHIPKLLSGIITMTMTASISMLIFGFAKEGQTFTNLVTLGKDSKTIYSMFWNETMPKTAKPYIEIGVMAFVVILVAIIIYYFFGTEYGMAIRTTGMNEKMAKAQGINTTVSTIVCVAMSNALIGLSGALVAQDRGSMDVKGAAGYLVIGLAAILIGESIFGTKTFKNRMISVLLGAVVYFVIITVAIELGFPTELKNLLYAFLITIALCLPLFKKLIKSKKGAKKNA